MNVVLLTMILQLNLLVFGKIARGTVGLVVNYALIQ